MEGIRIRGERASLRAVATLVLAMATLAAVGAALPTTAGAATQARTLFLTEQVRPGVVRGPISGPVQPQHMAAQPGEEEGFIVAVRPDRATTLDAVIDPSSSEFAQQWTQVLRSEWVNVRRPSTGTGARPGRYADPLPPQVPNAGAAGRLRAPANQWSAFVVLVSVPTATPAGTHAGVINVRDEAGTVIARANFSITIVATKNANGALDPAIAPHDPRNFKVLFNYSPNLYRSLAPAKTAQEQYEQTYRTLWMLSRHRAASSNWQKAYPTAGGTYECSAADGYLKVFDDMPWWADGRPGASPVALMPNHAVARCQSGNFQIKDDKSGKSKFDDEIGSVVDSAWFIYRMADHWRKHGIQDHRTYFLNPFDEPSAAQQNSSVRKVNELVHDYAPGVKVLGTTWPMEKRNEKKCRTVKGKRYCAMHRGQPHSNAVLRDGGKDDLDGWIVPYFRMYGFGGTPAQRRAGINRTREVINRLQQIKAGGGEGWTYDLPLPTGRVPQMAIDGGAADARVMFWPLGREGLHGWYTAMSNRWVDPVKTRTPRNPWDNPLSWVGPSANKDVGRGPQSAISNGWGSLFYPGYRPQLGLNDPLAQPVSSLRMQRLRDGVEDANLMRQYRDRFGQAALNRAVAGVLGPLTAGGDLLGNEVFPQIKTRGLALRMEIVRRQMLAALAQ